jgi:hypothetical protein
MARKLRLTTTILLTVGPRFLFSAALPKLKMILRAPHLIFLFCVVTLVVPHASNAYTYSYSYSSLYDEHTAQTVGPELRTFFGPRSAHIRYDARMIAAAQIAAERAHRHSTERCWHSVKNALVDAQVVPTRPTSEYAKEAGAELEQKYGFTKLRITSPFDAPVGAVLVYGGRGAGHVEIRTATGFVSDFISQTPSPRPLLGIYVKRS